MANCVGGKIDSGDTAYILFATTAVMLQTPAMGILQAGLIRRKNALSMIMQTLSGLVIGSIMWFIFGFALTFGPSQGRVIGNLDYAFMVEVPWDDCLPALAPTIPGLLFASFQMMFALMVPVIVTGAWTEKMTFKACIIFIIFWGLTVYYPLAHWMWNPGGWLHLQGAIDFAGGVPIHTASGAAGLVVSLMLQKRRGVTLKGESRTKIGKFVELKGPLSIFKYILRKPPTEGGLAYHNLPLAILGGCLVWFGWFSFNGGSAVTSGGAAVRALMNTQISSCVAAFIYVIFGYIQDRKWHVTELINGALAGLAGITPGSGFVEPYGAFAIGAIVAVVAYATSRILKRIFQVDDVLDVVALQGAAGGTGTILVGFFARSTTTTTLLFNGIFYGGGELLGWQILAVVVAIVWSSIWTFLIMIAMAYTPFIGIDISAEQEELGLDLSQIGEQAYDEKLNVLDDLGAEMAAARLCELCAAGDLKAVRSLLSEGVSPDGCDYDGRTAAHLAASEGHLELLKFLAVHGADLGKRDHFNMAPIDGAISNNKKLVVQWLQTQGFAPDPNKLLSELLHACAQGRTGEVKKLVATGVDVNRGDYDRRTPLMVAASEGRLSIVRLLVEKCGADISLLDRWGKTALNSAEIAGKKEVEEYLAAVTKDPSKAKKRSSVADSDSASDKEDTPDDVESGIRMKTVKKDDYDEDESSDEEDEAEEWIPKDSSILTSAREMCTAAAHNNIRELRRLAKKEGKTHSG